MKLIHVGKRVAFATVTVLVAVISCTKNSELAGGITETTSARIYGTIWNDDTTLAEGVVVKLVPVGYNAYTDSETVHIDSVVTDEEGTYSFTPVSSGYFNMIARREEKYCFEDSIAVSTTESTEIENDTLREYGALEGTVQVPPDLHQEEMVVLVLGTSVYTITDSATGAFSIPVLAEGQYIIRIFTSAHLYSYLDTLVIIRPGKTTQLEDLALPFIAIPEMENAVAEYDTRMMKTVLHWPQGDTADISGYYIFRNTGIGGKPYAILESTDTLFVDDLVGSNPDSLSYQDTLHYHIAAVGKDRTLQWRSAVQTVVAHNSVISLDSVPLPEFVRNWRSTVCLHADGNGNLYLTGYDNVVKMDTEGNMLARYHSTDDMYRALAVDAEGYVYVYRSLPHSRTLMKFTPELDLVKDTTLADVPVPGVFKLAFSADGLLHLFVTNSGNITAIHTFDTSLTIKRSALYPHAWRNVIQHDDSLLHYDFSVEPNGNDPVLTVRDFDENIVATRVIPADHSDPVYPAMDALPGVNKYYFTGDDRLISCGDLLSVFESDYSLNARCGIKGDVFTFDGNNRLYVINGMREYLYVYTVH